VQLDSEEEKHAPPVIIPFPVRVKEMGKPSRGAGTSNRTTTHASKLVKILREIERRESG